LSIHSTKVEALQRELELPRDQEEDFREDAEASEELSHHNTKHLTLQEEDSTRLSQLKDSQLELRWLRSRLRSMDKHISINSNVLLTDLPLPRRREHSQLSKRELPMLLLSLLPPKLTYNLVPLERIKLVFSNLAEKDAEELEESDTSEELKSKKAELLEE
jgi:hypothetical protein